MRKSSPISIEFGYQLLSLILIVILVHAVYLGIIRTKADAILAQQAAMAATDASYTAERSVYILVRDYEQEACFILLFWALSIMIYKAVTTSRNRALLQQDLLPLAEGDRILPEDTREFARKIQALPNHQRNALLPRALLAGLQRFRTTRNIQDVAGATHAYCVAESERLESELSDRKSVV